MNEFNVIPCVFAYFKRVHENQEQLLLLYRSNTSFGNNQYSLPGGKIDKDESPQQALIREIKEELDSEVDEKEVILSTLFYFKGSCDKTYMAFVFEIPKWTGEPINKEPLKHGHIKWFTLNDLPDNLLTCHANMLQHIHQGTIYAYGSCFCDAKIDRKADNAENSRYNFL